METNSITDYLQTLRDVMAATRMGLLPDGVSTSFLKFAGRLDIGTTSVIVATCENEEPFNTDANQLYISSSEDDDTQTISLQGVDQDFVPIDTTITLQGQTAVAIPTIYRTLYRGYVNDNTDLAGDVYVGTEATPTNGVPDEDNQYLVINAIVNGKTVNGSLTSVFTVPVGYTAFIDNWYVTADKGKSLDFTAYGRSENEVFRYYDRIQVYETSFQKQLNFFSVPEKTDMKIMAKAAASSSNGSVTYDMVLLNNDFLQKFRPLAFR